MQLKKKSGGIDINGGLGPHDMTDFDLLASERNEPMNE